VGIREAIAALRGTTPGMGDIQFTQANVSRVLGQSVEQLWREQPYLRTVVTFLARNIAQLGVHTFERVSETDRRRNRSDPMVAPGHDSGYGRYSVHSGQRFTGSRPVG